MNLWRLAAQSFWFHRRVNLASIAAVAVTTAVLTGALFVGDSLRGSLRRLTLDRLGRVDFALITDRFFRAAIADEIAASPGFDEDFAAAVPAVILPSVTVEVMGQSARARGVTLLGCTSSFWTLDASGSASGAAPTGDQVWLNQALADRLGVSVGDRLVLRLPQASDVPADSPLGRKEGTVRNLADLEVSAVLPDDGIASFQLHPSQSRSLNAFIDLSRLQAALDVRDRANAVFFAARSPGVALDAQAVQQLDAMIHPRLADYGIRLERLQQTYRDQDQDRVAFEYFHLINDRLVWSDTAREAAREALPPLATQELFTYLANSIGVGELSDVASDDVIPYSTIVAVDSNAEMGPLVSDEGQGLRLAAGEVALNRWAAEDLSAKVGDLISLRYFAPETTHGVAEERTVQLRLAAVAELTDPATPHRRRRPALFDRRPTLATDPHLTPTVKGVTDQETIADWDPPFPFDQRRIRDQDDNYWESFRTTPKAFVSLATGKRLWGSRFGETTAFRVPVDAGSLEQLTSALERSLHKRKANLGFGVLPIKANALRASRGTTSFAGLFIGFSLFLIVAALALLSILFRLGVELRGQELGLLAALGWTVSRSRRLLMLEGAGVGLIGAVLGVAGGAAFAALMLSGLRTLWVDAIVTPFVHFYATPVSILGGGLASVATCLLVMGFALRELLHREPRQLLAGSTARLGQAKRSPRMGWPIVAFVTLAVISAGWATGLTAEAQAGAFFAGGFCLLVAGLLGLRRLLHAAAAAAAARTLTLTQLAWKGLARHPGRTMLTAGLVAAATFLIMAIAAFRLTPGEQGTGGFELVAETDRPLFVDFADPQARRRVGGDEADTLNGLRVVGMRAEPGSDASCRNLYQATRPRMFGISRRDAEGILADAPFAWAGAVEPYRSNPWLALFQTSDAIPVILDKNTALFSLHAGGKVGAEFVLEDASGRTFRFQTVGLLSNSFLQGKLLVSDEQLVRLFPDNAGERFFLIDCEQAADCKRASQTLAERFGDEGWVARDVKEVLSELMAIQNTYLSTFQSLGALGLLLGTVGLACVQFRNLMERRSEMGLLQAIGFAPQRLRRLVLQESILLLLAGLAIGAVAALFTTVPHMVFGAASVPWMTIGGTLGLVVICGTASVALAVQSILRVPALDALRRE